MTIPPSIVATSVHMPPPSRHPRPRRRPRQHVVPAVVTALCVAFGFGIVTTTAPPSPTPGDVAQAFVEALVERDWETARQLHCRADDGSGARMTTLGPEFDIPAAAVVVVRDVTETRGSAVPSFTVTVTAAGIDSNGTPLRIDTVELPVVGEQGELRVCLAR
jgi:hypothetical protein